MLSAADYLDIYTNGEKFNNQRTAVWLGGTTVLLEGTAVLLQGTAILQRAFKWVLQYF